MWVYTDHRLSRAELLIRESDYEILFYIIHEQYGEMASSARD